MLSESSLINSPAVGSTFPYPHPGASGSRGEIHVGKIKIGAEQLEEDKPAPNSGFPNILTI